MLPEHLRTQLFPEQSAANTPSLRLSIVDLIHANQVQTMVSRTAAAQFAHTHGLNLIDFHVVQSVISLGDDQETATPGYIARGLSLSASTLTSILERLVRSGYLVRERDSADRRRISIYHTDKSAQLMADFYRHLAAQYEAAFESADEAAGPVPHRLHIRARRRRTSASSPNSRSRARTCAAPPRAARHSPIIRRPPPSSPPPSRHRACRRRTTRRPADPLTPYGRPPLLGWPDENDAERCPSRFRRRPPRRRNRSREGDPPGRARRSCTGRPRSRSPSTN